MIKPTADKLVYFGTDAFSVAPLIRLLAEGWRIVAVVTKPDTPAGRGRQVTMPAVKRLAVAQGIPVFQPHHVIDCLPDLQKLQPDAGLVVAYGKIISTPILKLFPKGLINIHPSLLPKYRGATPIESAILSGDTETGITLMRVDEGVDAGPIYDAAKLQLTGTETRFDLYEQLANLGADLLSAKLPHILGGTLVAIPQDNRQAVTVGRIQKSDGVIDWSLPAALIERQIRAYMGWPGSRTRIADTDVIITAAHVLPASGRAGVAYRAPSGELAVYTGEGSLVIDQLKPAGKRDMTGLEFLAGHPLQSHPAGA